MALGLIDKAVFNIATIQVLLKRLEHDHWQAAVGWISK